MGQSSGSPSRDVSGLSECHILAPDPFRALLCWLGIPCPMLAILAWTTPLLKVPLPRKIKIFVWQLLRDRLPSRKEVVKRNGSGNGLCPLCGVLEIATHISSRAPLLFFLDALSLRLWGLVGRPSTWLGFLKLGPNRTRGEGAPSG